MTTAARQSRSVIASDDRLHRYRSRLIKDGTGEASSDVSYIVGGDHVDVERICTKS